MLSEVLPESGTMTVNYGTNRVRFLAPVPSGSRVRGRFRVLDVEPTERGDRVRIEATVECEGIEKPVCVAELLVLAVS
jgi:acyl dehydratase